MKKDTMIDLLKQIEKDIYVNSLESTFKQDSKSCAIHEAIELLQKEPCEDAISKKVALDAMRGLTRWCVRSEDGRFNNVGLLYDDVMFGIDKLPSVNPILKESPETFNKDAESESMLNADLISRRAALLPYDELRDNDVISVRTIRDNIKYLPSVQPQKVVKRKAGTPRKDYEPLYNCENWIP